MVEWGIFLKLSRLAWNDPGTTKCFPIVLRYLYFEEGVQHALLDFYSDSNETSEGLTNQLLAAVCYRCEIHV